MAKLNGLAADKYLNLGIKANALMCRYLTMLNFLQTRNTYKYQLQTQYTNMHDAILSFVNFKEIDYFINVHRRAPNFLLQN